MNHLQEPAAEFAQKYYPIYEDCDDNELTKNRIAYQAFRDGFNEAISILRKTGNVKNIDTNFYKPGSIDWEK